MAKNSARPNTRIMRGCQAQKGFLELPNIGDCTGDFVMGDSVVEDFDMGDFVIINFRDS